MISLLIHNPLKAGLTETSFGGRPVANKPHEFDWPNCTCCQLPMQFLGKIASENYLYQIFMCQNDPGVCEEWDPDEGANKVIVTAMSALESVPFPAVGVTSREIEYSAHTIAVHSNDYEEARQTWVGENNVSYREVLGQINGAPFWLQGDETPKCNLCKESMHLLAQLEEGPANDTAMNFGGGSAYIFKCTCSNSAKFLWQC